MSTPPVTKKSPLNPLSCLVYCLAAAIYEFEQNQVNTPANDDSNDHQVEAYFATVVSKMVEEILAAPDTDNGEATKIQTAHWYAVRLVRAGYFAAVKGGAQ